MLKLENFTWIQTGVRVIRDYDSKTYDFSDKTFKALKDCKTPISPLTKTDFGVVSTSIDISKWLDGGYTAYFHDTSTDSKQVFRSQSMTLRSGAIVNTVTATDVAARLMAISMASHVIEGSLGQMLNKMSKDISDIKKGLTDNAHQS